MTLIIAAGHERDMVLVADRRLTVNARVQEEESNKTATLMCRDGRVAVAFTGLARADRIRFQTRPWLLEALADSARGFYTLEATMHGLAQAATVRINRLPIGDREKRLTIVAAGYLCEEDVALPRLWFLSNWEEPWRERPLPRLGDFKAYFYPPAGTDAAVTLPVMACGAVPFGASARALDSRMQELADMVGARRPGIALANKATGVLQEFAASDESKGLVGESCMSTVISRDPTRPITGQYHSRQITNKMYGPDHVEARGGDFGVHIMSDLELTLFDADKKPIKLGTPRVPRNHPCPCGSGRKYKRCHGRPLTPGFLDRLDDGRAND